MRRKLKDEDKEREFEECSQYNLEDCDLNTAIEVYPKKKVKKTYPLTLRIHKVDIIEAKKIGRLKGIPYQTLLKTYIKRGLEQDRKGLVS